MNLRDIAHLAETIQPVPILAGGLWGFYLYRLARGGRRVLGADRGTPEIVAKQGVQG